MDYSIHSRVHRIPSFDTLSCSVWIKRDDELGFGISGTKLRKYHSLIPHLIRERYDLVSVLGGANSNNVLGLSQLLVENRIPFKLYLKGNPNRPLQGNGMVTFLIAGQHRIRWLSSQEWPEAGELALRENTGRVFVVPEGASCPQALEGTLTLFQDIKQNEKEAKVHFDHIFIDAGTGFTAQVLAQQLEGSCQVHVVCMADPVVAFPSSVIIYRPRLAPSFGSVNTAVMNEIRRMASHEGVLLDPIYTAKLFYEARHVIKEKQLQGNCLIIHSGGALTLLGFTHST